MFQIWQCMEQCIMRTFIELFMHNVSLFTKRIHYTVFIRKHNLTACVEFCNIVPFNPCHLYFQFPCNVISRKDDPTPTPDKKSFVLPSFDWHFSSTLHDKCLTRSFCAWFYIVSMHLHIYFSFNLYLQNHKNAQCISTILLFSLPNSIVFFLYY
jgi:hypothetical protein